MNKGTKRSVKYYFIVSALLFSHSVLIWAWMLGAFNFIFPEESINMYTKTGMIAWIHPGIHPAPVLISIFEVIIGIFCFLSAIKAWKRGNTSTATE